MRVTFITEEWRRNGGVGAYVRRLAAAMAARGGAVQVVHSDPDAALLPGVENTFVANLTTHGHGDAATRASGQALSVIAAFRPDVVHVQGCNNFIFEGALRARHRATKTLHVYDYCPSNTKYHHALDRACTHPTGPLCLPRLGYKRCTTSRRPNVWMAQYARTSEANRSNAGYRTIVVASDYVRRHAIASGYGPEQVTVVPYFVEDAPASEPEAGTIVTAGRLVREKGFDLFIDALARVAAPWRAIIAGDGMERQRLERHARDAGLADRITFAGWQDDAGMAALYARASIVVMPSRWPEPSGIVGLEAMAHGRPVVAFAVGGIPEWLADGVTGRLVPAGDARALAGALTTLLEDPAAAARMGSAGRARARAEFSVERHLPLLAGVYGSLTEHAA